MDEQKERAAFEADWRARNNNTWYCENAWIGWQARAVMAEHRRFITSKAMSAHELPPLPEPHRPRGYHGGVSSGGYTKDQMHEYARAALAAAPAPAPLTHEQIIDGYCTTRHAPQFVSAFAQGVRFAERAHGIGTDAARAQAQGSKP